MYLFIYPFHLSTCFEHQVLIIRRSNCINTSSGMISLCKWLLGTPVRRELMMSTWCSRHVDMKWINKYMKKCIRLVVNKNLNKSISELVNCLTALITKTEKLRNELFCQILRIKKIVWRKDILFFQWIIGHFIHEHLLKFLFTSDIFAMKAFLCNAQYFYGCKVARDI
jgi:hypothetical protein